MYIEPVKLSGFPASSRLLECFFTKQDTGVKDFYTSAHGKVFPIKLFYHSRASCISLSILPLQIAPGCFTRNRHLSHNSMSAQYRIAECNQSHVNVPHVLEVIYNLLEI